MLAALQKCLLAVATSATIWASDILDGGFLNDIFTVTGNSTITLRPLTMQGILSVVGQNLFGGGRTNLAVYNWLPPELRSGDRPSNQIAILTGIMILLACLLLVLPIFVAVVFWDCGQCCRRGRKTFPAIPTLDESSTPDGPIIETLHHQLLKVKSDSGRGFVVCHWASFFLSLLLLLAFVVVACVYLYAGALLIDPLAVSPSPSNTSAVERDTLLGELQYSLAAAMDFIQLTATSGREHTQVLVGVTNATLDDLLQPSVSIAVDKLLEAYGVSSLLSTGENLQKDINVLQTNMEYIRLNNQKVSADISNFVGQFKTIYNLVFPELTQVCITDFGPQINGLCTSLKDRASVLLLQFNATAIEVEPPAVLNFILNSLGIDLDALLGQLIQVSNQISQIKDEVLLKVYTFMDISQLFSPLMQLWDLVDEKTSAVNTVFKDVIVFASQTLITARPFVEIIVYLPAAIFGLILIYAIVITILYAIEVFMHSILPKPPANGDPAGDPPERSMNSAICTNCGHVVLAVLLGVFLLVVCLLLVFTLPVVTLVSSGGCVYLTVADGVAQSDYVLNSLIETQLWPQILTSLLAHVDASTGDFLNLASPDDLIRATTVTCKPGGARNDSTGLLGAVGWTSIIDMPALLNSEILQSKFDEGEKILMEEIVKLDLASLIPADLDKFADTTKNLTMYFDKMNYSTSIDELAPERLPTRELTVYADDLDTLVDEIKALGLGENLILRRSVELIRGNLETAVVISEEAKRLRGAFVAVQMRRNLTQGIDELIQNVSATTKIVSNETTLLEPVPEIYKAMVEGLKVDLETTMTPVIENFTQELAPCSDLYTAVDTILAMTCMQNGAVNRLFAWAFAMGLSAVIVYLLFICLYNLAFIQSHQFRRHRVRNNRLSSKTSTEGYTARTFGPPDPQPEFSVSTKTLFNHYAQPLATPQPGLQRDHLPAQITPSRGQNLYSVSPKLETGGADLPIEPSPTPVEDSHRTESQTLGQEHFDQFQEMSDYLPRNSRSETASVELFPSEEYSYEEGSDNGESLIGSNIHTPGLDNSPGPTNPIEDHLLDHSPSPNTFRPTPVPRGLNQYLDLETLLKTTDQNPRHSQMQEIQRDFVHDL